MEFSSNTFVAEFISFSTELFPEHIMLKGSFDRVGKILSFQLVLKPLLFKECFELPKMVSYVHKISLLSGKKRGVQYFLS